MDRFAGNEFPVPYDVAPFPDSGDLLYTPVTLIPSLEIVAHRQNPPPPQKLRPIRCNGKSSPGSQVGELPEDGTVASLNVGYLANQLCVLNGESSLNLEPLEQLAEAGEALRKENCGRVAGNASLHMEDPVAGGSGDATHICDPNAEGCLLALGQESGSSLDDDDDDDNSSGCTKEPGSRKRKTVRKLEDFVEKMVMKVMEKQEQMHKQLVDMIEKKEKERIMREEAWKHKEMERIKKDEEARAQEKSRNLALISFIQNLLGHEIQIPEPSPVSSKREENEGEANIGKDLNSDPSNNNRWPEVEVQALINVRTSLEPKFHVMGSKGSIWDEISEAMHNMGYNRSAKKCKEKWENINKYYKRTVGSGKKRRQNSKACPYFDELDILYRNGVLNLGNALSNINDVNKIEKE